MLQDLLHYLSFLSQVFKPLQSRYLNNYLILDQLQDYLIGLKLFKIFYFSQVF